ncbi:MAG: cofactor-independent phosphoglycerate mutase [Dehalococcoidia bacterium]
MRYCILIPDGAADWPLEERSGKTCFELAHIPNLDTMAREGTVGMALTVPDGMEPSSACACMSIMGYDPRVYYAGRGPIEANSMGIELQEGEVAFRCNTVTVQDGRMRSFNAGHITDPESRRIIETLNEELGNERIRFHPGIGYRHILTIKEGTDALGAMCTPPHDISDRKVDEYVPQGPGSEILLELMEKSGPVLETHPVNIERIESGKLPANMIWLFWGGKAIPPFPSFYERFGLKAAITSGVGLLEGLANLTGMTVLDIPGVTDNIDNDYRAQREGALMALQNHDLVFIHIEAPDECGHEALIDEKVKSIEMIDDMIVSSLRGMQDMRVLAMPDHPTPIRTKTHVAEPVPFVIWGPGHSSNGAGSFSEKSAGETGLFVEHGHQLVNKLIMAECD